MSCSAASQLLCPWASRMHRRQNPQWSNTGEQCDAHLQHQSNPSNTTFPYALLKCKLTLGQHAHNTCTYRIFGTCMLPKRHPPKRTHCQSTCVSRSLTVLWQCILWPVQAEHSSISSVFTKPWQVWDSKVGVAPFLSHILQCLSVHTELEWHAPHGTVSMPSALLRFTA